MNERELGGWPGATRVPPRSSHGCEVLQYDCFNRVQFPSQRIDSVTDCIELFEVASRIQYDQVLGICERYLSAVPWRDAEGERIRAFRDSGQMAFNPASVSCKRQELPPNEEERMHGRFNVTERALKRSPELSSSPFLSESRRESSLAEFQDGFFELAKAAGLVTRSSRRSPSALS